MQMVNPLALEGAQKTRRHYSRDAGPCRQLLPNEATYNQPQAIIQRMIVAIGFINATRGTGMIVDISAPVTPIHCIHIPPNRAMQTTRRPRGNKLQRQTGCRIRPTNADTFYNSSRGWYGPCRKLSGTGSSACARL